MAMGHMEQKLDDGPVAFFFLFFLKEPYCGEIVGRLITQL